MISEEMTDILERVYFKVLNLLAGSSRSQKEIKTKLDKYLFKEKISSIDKNSIKKVIIERLRDHGYYDDKKFTIDFIDNMLLSSKPRSKKQIKNKLYSKGVDPEIIEKYISKFDDSRETESAKTYLRKISKRYTFPLSFKDKNKLIKQLLSRGFDYQIAKTLVDSIDSVK